VPPADKEAEAQADAVMLMKQCWAEQPADRPSFDDIAKALKRINKGK
jgi:Protein tyrosine and serine/threonine kinase